MTRRKPTVCTPAERRLIEASVRWREWMVCLSSHKEDPQSYHDRGVKARAAWDRAVDAVRKERAR